MNLSVQDVARLADPRVSLPLYATLVGQKHADLKRYDPYGITALMQATILAYVGDPPRGRNGETLWLVLLKGRQAGASTTADLAFYPPTMYNAGRYHLTIADQRDRVDYLHTRLQLNHKLWPAELKMAQVSTNEIRRLSFENGSSMDVRSGGAHAVGVGQSPDSVHASEIPLWDDAETQYSLMVPAMFNRMNSLFITESTPYPLVEPSSEFMRDLCSNARKREGRYIYAFFPYWDCLLNVRPWPNDWTPDSEEEGLLHRYGARGLRLEHLAFRREVMNTDNKIKRDPRLFDVFYPSNDRDCWITSSRGIIPDSALSRQSKHVVENAEPETGLWIYKEPTPGAVYVMGIDPSGYGRDHHAFQVLEVWDDEWEQVASFGDECDPLEFGERVWDTLRKFNNAYALPERNGVGMGIISLLKYRDYRNVMHDAVDKPGVHIASHDKLIESLVDAMLDQLIIRGASTFDQLQTYRGDRVVQQSVASAIINDGTPGKGRRKRHHWDKASALAIACLGARRAPRRYKNMVLRSPGSWTYNDWMRYREMNRKDSTPPGDAFRTRR